MSKNLKIFLIVIGIILIIAFLLFGWFVGEYNKVIAMDENVKDYIEETTTFVSSKPNYPFD